MDFLTRLAQRITGEMPAVQPRLPLLFEPAAAIARSATALEEQETLLAPELAESTPATVPARHPMPAAALPAPQGLLPSSEPFRAPLRVAEQVRPSPSFAADESRDIGSFSFAAPDAAPAHENRPPARDHAAPRRGVPVAIRPAAAPSAPRSPSADSRRGTIASPLNHSAQPGRAGGRTGDLPGPPTVHVHIGRVDVRAVMPPAAPARPPARPAAPRTTLEDYLSGRKGGSQP
jgi:hypothetical protein